MASTRGKRSDAEASARRRSSGEASASGNARHGTGRPLIDLDFVRGLISAVDESGIDSLEITRAGTKIRVSKTPPPAQSGAVGPAVTYAPAAGPPAAPQAAAPAAGGGGASASGTGEEDSGRAPQEADSESKSRLVDVTSPMVGTFYRAPAPEAPPYVEVGSTVTKGQTLCILEAMKLMNEMESEVEGVVREVLVENSEPVEYGQVLFRIEPSGGR